MKNKKIFFEVNQIKKGNFCLAELIFSDVIFQKNKVALNLVKYGN